MIWIVDAFANAFRLLSNLLARLGPPLDYVVVEIAGSYPERTPPPRRLTQRLLQPPWQRTDESLEALRDRLERVARAPGVRGIVLRVRDLSAGLAALQGLRDAIAELRRGGKRVIAYLTEVDLSAYYLATAADEIWMPAVGFWNVLGMRTEITFFRDAFNRIGVLPEFERMAEYKTAADRFVRSSLSEHHREMLDAILDSWMQEVTGDIAAARRLNPDNVRAAVDRAPLTAADARAAGLIDGLCYEDELPARLGSPERPAALQPWAAARRRLSLPYRWRARGPVIAVVELIGGIITGESRDSPIPIPLVGGRLAGSETIARAFRAAERSPRIRAIVFHVDSGGGSALASDLILREVERIKVKKPIVAFMGNVAGSGGYYVSCGASRIVAQPATITGSIGVVTGKLSAQGLYERLGLNREVVARGEAATMDSLFRPFTPAQRGKVRRAIDEIYRVFVGKVASGRGKSVGDVEAIAKGRVWTGRQALERGLVDELGDFSLAVRRARELAGIPADTLISTVTVRPPRATPVPSAAQALAAALGPASGAVLAETVAAWRAVRELLREPALLLMPDLGAF
ncbi:MAG: signal peptide peptidase SppA [Armatimonadota bacterium]